MIRELAETLVTTETKPSPFKPMRILFGGRGRTGVFLLLSQCTFHPPLVPAANMIAHLIISVLPRLI